MEDVQLLKGELRSHFFELVSSISTYSYDELLQIFIEQLDDLLKVNSQLLLYNRWNLTYRVIKSDGQNLFETDQTILEFVESYIQNSKKTNKNEIIIKPFKGKELLIVPLNYGEATEDLLLIRFDSALISHECIKMVKVETEQFLTLVSKYIVNQSGNKKNKFLYEMSSNLHSVTDLTIILKKMIDLIKKVYPTFTYFILLSQDHEDDATLPVKSLEYSDDETKRASMQAFTTGEVQLERENKKGGIHLYAPLNGSQGVYGVLQIVATNIANFPKNEIDFINKFATTAGHAIENAILYRTSNHLVSDLKLINRVTHKLNSNLQLSEILTIVKKEVTSLSEESQIGFIYYNNSEQKIELLEGSSPFFTSELGNSFVHYVTEQMDVNQEAIFSGDYRKNYPNLPFRSVMIIPMLNDEVMLGFVAIMHEEPSFFSFAKFKLMKSLIQHSSLALTNTILKEQLEQAVITDYMTKLYSRKHLDDLIHKHMKYDQQGTLVLFDIDDFKSINDTYGHHIGDKVIIQTANIIKKYSREADIPTRWGGEEIAIYLPHVALEAGVKLAARISKKVAEQTSPRITLSSGVAAWNEKKRDSVTDLFIRADEALYRAKEKGKNQVVTAEYEVW